MYIYSPSLSRDLGTTALLINGGSVTVWNNTLRGWSTGNYYNGLTIKNHSKSIIRKNNIQADGSLEEGGMGIVIDNSNPTIEFNRIRGGGVSGVGINVYDSYPNIFNNMILGCEDGTKSQDCYGVVYAGQSGAGGKLYNNTIFGSMSTSDSTDDYGGRGTSIYTTGIVTSPEIINNILYTQNKVDNPSIIDDKGACIKSESYSAAAVPASIYNNTCIQGDETCFQILRVIEDKSTWEILTSGLSKFEDSWDPMDFLSIPFLIIDNNDGIDRPILICRSAEDSNADDIWKTYSASFPNMMDWIGNHYEWTPSGGNTARSVPNFFVDIDGPDDDFSTLEDNDWHLAGVAAGAIIEEGKCVAPALMLDMDLTLRTPHWKAATGCEEETGYSRGAFEYNY